MVDDKDRKAYEEGAKNRGKSGLQGFVTDFDEAIRDHGRTESQQSAYNKGRDGKPLDQDKK